MLRLILIAAFFAVLGAVPATARSQARDQDGHYRNFRVAVYVVVNSTRQLADPETFERQFERVMSQVPFDKVYVEAYRNRQFATDEE
ncbi:MAG TPA: hypothetical protein VE175_06070, partial [Woeseiaceae bacterium]|nr:hypothetical protein [Woeseiaceae bacterium]